MANDSGLVEFSGHEQPASPTAFSYEQWGSFTSEQLANEAKQLLDRKGWHDWNFGLGVALGDSQRKFLMTGTHRTPEGQWMQGNNPVDISPEELQVLEDKAGKIPQGIADKATPALMGRYLEIRSQLYYAAYPGATESSPKTLATDHPDILKTIADAAFAYEATGTGIAVHQLGSPQDLLTTANLNLKLAEMHRGQMIKREFAERIPKAPNAKPEPTQDLSKHHLTDESKRSGLQKIRAALGRFKR